MHLPGIHIEKLILLYTGTQKCKNCWEPQQFWKKWLLFPNPCGKIWISCKDTFNLGNAEMPKNSIQITIEKAINCGMAYLFALLYVIFCLEKMVIYGFSSYLGLKESIRHKK